MELSVERILSKIQDAIQLYYQLIFLVGASGTGKTQVLRAIHERTGAPIINVSLELSKAMLELNQRQRMLQLPKLLSGLLGQSNANIILLDNIEILFAASMKQDPLRLLQGLSRNKTIVASCSGMIEGDYLVYAEPDHPEYKRYPTRDLLIECTIAH
jgi:predicted ATPase